MFVFAKEQSGEVLSAGFRSDVPQPPGCPEQVLPGTFYCTDHDVTPEQVTTCAIQGCDRTVFNTGLCDHDFQSWKYGHNRTRYRTRTGDCGGRCAVCRWDHAREAREDRLAALERGPLNEQTRYEIVRRVWEGEPLKEAVSRTGLSVRQVWSTGVACPGFLDVLNAGLMAWRDPSISHGTAYSYRFHRCPCPQCRAAKARSR